MLEIDLQNGYKPYIEGLQVESHEDDIHRHTITLSLNL